MKAEVDVQELQNKIKELEERELNHIQTIQLLESKISKLKHTEIPPKSHIAGYLENWDQFDAVFGHTNDSVVVVDMKNQHIVMANQTACQKLGYIQHELLDTSISDLISEFNQHTVSELLEKYPDQETPIYEEVPILRKDGTTIFLEITTSAFMFESKMLMICLLRDITQRRRIKFGLQLAQQVAKSGQWELDLVNNQLYWSTGVFDIFEFDPSNSKPSYSAFLEAVHPDDQDMVDKVYSNSLLTNEPYVIYHRALMKDGRIKYVKEACHTEFDEAGTPLYSIGIIQDITDLQQTREELRKSEYRFRGLVENSLDWIWETDITHKFTYVSPRVKNLLGFEPDELLGKTPFELLSPNQTPQTVSQFESAVESGIKVENLINIYVRKDGNPVIMETSGMPVLDKNGELSGFQGTSRDITVRKKAEEQIKTQKIMLQTILDSIQEPAFLLTNEGKVLFANQSLGKRLNIPPENIVGKNITRLLPADIAASGVRRGKEVIKSGKHQRFEDRYEDRFMEHFMYPFLNPEGKSNGLAILSIDITERIKKEEELRTLWMAVEQSPSSILITNIEGIIEYVNPGFCETSGYSSEEVIGQNSSTFNSSHHSNSFYKQIWKTLASGNTWHGEICNCKKNGELYWEQARLSPVVDDTGKTTHYIAVNNDITQKKELEYLKEDTERIMRHDMKTPLSGIINYPNLLLRTELTDHQKKLIHRIYQSGITMLRIIDTYLDMIKMEAGTYNLDAIPLNLVAILQNVFSDLEADASKKQIEFKLSINNQAPEKDALVTIKGEDLLCYSMFSNLIKNAIEASPDQSLVSVNVVTQPSEVIIQIQNQGLVPEDIKERFFDKYVTHGKSNGTGLGTYSARLTAEAQGGEISMQSNAETGTVISVTIPT